MKKQIFVFLLACTLFAGCKDSADLNLPNESDAAETLKTPQSAEGDIIRGQYIFEFNADAISSASSRLDWGTISNREEKIAQMDRLNADVTAEINDWLSKYNVTTDEILHIYTAAFVGVALKVSDDKYEEMRKDGDLVAVEHDRVDKLPEFQIESVDAEGAGARAQTTPCGITNAGGAANAGTSRWIWIIDSGIDLNHPDLNVVTSSTYARSFVGGTPDDCNGHGTHVAGTAAARNNTIGVIGVAAGAPVVPVRVFGCSGGSATSTIVAGINHAATYDYPGDVANLSLGGYYGSGCSTGSSYRSALTSLANRSRIAIASGNNLNNAAFYQPACVNGTNIYTVTNMRCNKSYYNDPTFGGNYGRPPVDYIATGTSVYSTYKNGGYATLTGTSMATPHVAGIMQIRNSNPRSVGTVSYGGVSYPIAKR